MLEEETNKVESGEKVDVATEDYLATIKKLKENSVDRVEFEALREQNKKLLDAVINGNTDSTPVNDSEGPQFRDTEVLKQIILSEDSSNLEYWTAFIELRDKVIAEKGYDPVVSGGIGPNGVIEPEVGEAEGMNEQMETIRECIKIADGDKQVFLNEMSKRAR